ncbi:MAG: asparagine synthase (glutamine-hydrolyzing) [Candidatus Scalindua sp.]
MCGICGMVGKSDADLIEAMCNSLLHRGPDDKGVFIDANVAIGSRRLSIIDLETGHQPLSNEKGNLWITYNGMIYNYVELRKILREKGHRFKTSSDTEVIIHAYEEYGERCVNHLNGDFAFAIWDVERQELFAARDRVGVKPFYYWHNGNTLLFASEIKAILQDRSFQRMVNFSALYRYLSRLSVWGEETIFEGIRRLSPAHSLRFKDGRLTKQCYWKPDFSKKLVLPKHEYKDVIYQSFREAVRRRMISDVPIGVFLSGGVDSSIIAAVMSEISDKPVKTFSFGFEADDSNIINELGYARKVARYLGTDHHEFVLQATEVPSKLPYLLWHFDEPFAGTLPHYFVASQANTYVKVALGGTGGDELFGDYGRPWWFSRMLDPRTLQYVNCPGRLQSYFKRIISSLPDVGMFRHYRKRGFDIIRQANDMGRLYVDGYSAIFTTEQKIKLCQPWVLESVQKGETLEDIIQEHYVESEATELMDKIFYVDLKTQLVDEYCYWTDCLSMAASVETRVPFLDHEFIELVISIPTQIRSKRDDLKYLLREAMCHRLPEEVFVRPKGGMCLPLDDWLRNDLYEMAIELLNPMQVQKRGYFNCEYVTKLLNDHISRRADNTYRLWVLIMFELWHRIYIDNHCFTEAEVLAL